MPKLKWQDPLLLAQNIAQNYDDDWCFLYSGLNADIKNSKSYIALFVKDQIISDDFFAVKKIINQKNDKYFGYISYETANNFEKLDFPKQEFIKQIPIYLNSYHLILEFDHDNNIINATYSDIKYLNLLNEFKTKKNSINLGKISQISSNFTDSSYLRAIQKIQEQIANGDFYQTNLTRKFFGEFNNNLSHFDNFNLFKKLCQISPANYSALIKIGQNYIISASPELYLHGDNNIITSKPIKGTSPRNENKNIDEQNKIYLKNSIKEKSENLMIVDLVRNDLSRICQAGSIKVDELFKITSYRQIHHMSSQISGTITKDYNIIDAIEHSFPPGSMTGAPKISAIENTIKLEKFKRGIYSGTIGIFSKNYLNLSVVIRTLITNNNSFEFQVGGAITHSSIAQSELEETFSKAKNLTTLLQIDLNKDIKK